MFVGGDKDTGLAVVFGRELSWCWSWGVWSVAHAEQLLIGVGLGRPTFPPTLMMSRRPNERIVDGGLC